MYEPILSFKSKPYSPRAVSHRKGNRKSEKLFPFVKMEKKNMDIYLYSLSRHRFRKILVAFLCISVPIMIISNY